MSCGDRSRSPREGRINHTFGLPWAQGTPGPSRQPSLPVFKRRAFDHLLGLKIFYAKSSGPLRSRTGVLAPWLLGPCPLVAQQHLLQFRLGEQGQGWQLSPLSGHMPPRGCLRAPLPARGEMNPFLVPPGRGSLTPGVCIYISTPLSSHVTCMLYSTAKVKPFLPRPAPCLPPLGCGGHD